MDGGLLCFSVFHMLLLATTVQKQFLFLLKTLVVFKAFFEVFLFFFYFVLCVFHLICTFQICVFLKVNTIAIPYY